MNELKNLFFIFLTGLTTGGLSCLALQGGLLTSILTKKEDELEKQLTLKHKSLPLITFLSSKIVIHTILGLLLGLLGSSFDLSVTTKGYLQIAIAIYLFGVAGATLDLHPLFRYFIIKPPKFLAKLAKNQSKQHNLFAPAILGALTIFLPCATTQAMEIIAIGTGSPLYGAAIMFAFTLGASPTFLILGYLFTKLSDSHRAWFHKITAVLLFLLAITTFNAGMTLAGSVYTFDNFVHAATTNNNSKTPKYTGTMTKDLQQVIINVTNSGYTPKVVTLKKGVKVRVILNSQNVRSCSRSFTIPSLNIEKLLPVDGATIIEFTPIKTGPISFSCTMGMYTGQFMVVN